MTSVISRDMEVLVGTDPNRTGDITEHKAIVWLLDQGYEVFHNVSCVGPVDIIVMSKETGKILKVDVKTIGKYRSLPPNFESFVSPFQKELEVIPLIYCQDNNLFFFPPPDDAVEKENIL